MDTAAEVLAELGITQRNAGVCLGPDWLNADQHFPSINPANEQVIAWAGQCSRSQYEQVLHRAAEAFSSWRMVPAPRRGELVRLIVEELRGHKSALGSLIALETGKIKEEGDGEV
jgi:aldehyde dehydrogenase (NAD+)